MCITSNQVISVCLLQTIWPERNGTDGPWLQSYNAVLSLSSLQNSSDGIFVLENDWLWKLCRKMGTEYCYDYYNVVASQQLANLLLPLSNASGINHTLSKFLLHFLLHDEILIFMHVLKINQILI